MEAHSILNCVAIAMDAEDVSPGDGPHYPTLIETACDLINESICRLDEVNLGRAMKTLDDEEDEDELEEGPTVKRGGRNEVREPPMTYGCEQSTAGSQAAAAGRMPVVPEPETQDELAPDRTVH